MIKQDITYEDFDGVVVTETHYFHLSKSELIDLELGTEGGLAAKLTRISGSANGAEIMNTFKDLISKAYGRRVEGNASKFDKSPQLSAEFMSSLAFDAFLGMLLTDAKAASDFVNGIMPKDLIAMVDSGKVKPPNPNVLHTIPDPNKLDTGGGTWPRVQPQLVPLSDGYTEAQLAAAKKKTGLNQVFDDEGYPVAWAFREPDQEELTTMNHEQLLDVMRRKSSGWTPWPVS